MSTLVTTVEVNVSGAGEVEGLAAALKDADEYAGKLQETLRGGLKAEGIGSAKASLDELVLSMRSAAKELGSTLAGIKKASEDAAAGIKSAADTAKSLADADKAVADSGRAAADAQKSLGDASGTAAKTQADAADSGRALADASKGIADASPAAAGGIKDVGAAAADSAKATRDSAAWMAEYRKVMVESAAVIGASQADMAATVNRSQISIARGEKALADVQVMSAREAAKAQRAAHAETAASAQHAHNVVLGVSAAIGYGIWQAGKLQTQVTRLYTSAGEPQKNLPADMAGILGMAGPTATDQTALASGAYWASSAGFHGKDLMTVLRSEAQGAYAEGAPLQDVANADTSILTAYGMRHPTLQQANAVMNQMLAAVGSGKMTMAGLAAALPSVLPVAASAGLSLPQVLGSLATMTQTGMSPDWAAQNLRHTIGSLQSPSSVQVGEMYQLGLDPVKIAQNLGKTGISGTLNEIQSAITAHTDKKTGLVDLPAMSMNKAAQQDALVMMKEMPPAIRAVAREYWDGQISAKAWNKEMFSGSESGRMKNLLQEFGAVTNVAHGFNTALKAGQPDAQAYNAAVSKLLGGTVGMQTFLDLAGGKAKVTAQDIATVAQAAKDAGTNVAGWDKIQQTFDYQRKSFEYSAKAAATTAGAALLPVATDAMSGLAHAGSFLAGHKKLTVDLAIAGGGLALIEAGKKIASPLETALAGVGKISKALDIPGLSKLADIGKGGGPAGAASAGLDRVGPAANAAAEGLSRLAGVTDTGGVAGAGTRAATAAEGAAEGAGAGWLARAGGIRGIAGKLGAAGIGASIVIPMLESSKNEKALLGTNPSSWWNSWTPTEHAFQDVGHFFSGGGFPGLPQMWAKAQAASRAAYAASPQAMTGDVASEKSMAANARVTVPVHLQADTAAMAGISAKLRSITSITAPKVNMSGVTASVSAGMSSAAAAARTGEGQITSAVSQIGSKVRSVTASFAGGMAAAGASLDQGLASGISANEGAVVGAATAVANAAASAMRAALKTSSPSKVAITIGEQTVQGLVIGLMGGQSAVDAAANALGKAAVPQDITSIVKATSQIVSLISQAVAKHEIPRSEGTFLTKMLERDQGKLEQLARRRAALEQQIQNAAQITQSAIAQGGVLNAVQTVQSGPAAAQSPDEIVSGMQQQAASAKQFAAELSKLGKAGLNATSLAEIAQAGPQAGLATAAGIDAGGKAAISSINQYEKQIIQAGQQLGDIGGPAMYQSGVDIAKDTAKGLKSQLSQVDAAMQAVAKQMLLSLKQVLGGSGAGSAGYQLGQQIAAGIAAGISASASSIEGAITGAAGVGGHGKGKPGHHAAAHGHVHGGPPAYYGGAAAGYSAPEGPPPGPPAGYGLPGALPFGGGYHGGQIVQHHHHTTVHVHGNVTSEGDLATRLQSIYLQRASNNMSSGLRLPGRAA